MRKDVPLSPPSACGYLAALALLLAACSDNPSGLGRSLPLSPVLVSAPLFSTRAAATSGTTGGGTAVAYVSMPPGTDPSGVSVTVRNGRGGLPRGAPMADGGFDPLAITAQPGDTLLITFDHTTGAPAQGYAVVPAHSRPVVVRTSPPDRKTDVVLNTQIVVIFNQPMDSASLRGALHLRLNGTDVAGTVTPAPGESDILSVWFVPVSPLGASQTYEFAISTAAQGQNGDSLATPVHLTFSTGTDTAAVAALVMGPSPVQIVAGWQLQLWAVPVDAQHRPLDGTCVWNTSDATVATISAVGSDTREQLLSALTPGIARIRAECSGLSSEDTVTVLSVPVAASITLAPDTLSVAAGTGGFLVHAIVQDSSGREVFSVPVSWTSSNTNVASVSGQYISGLDHDLAGNPVGPAVAYGAVVSTGVPGSVTVTATAEGHSGTAILDFAFVTLAAVSVERFHSSTAYWAGQFHLLGGPSCFLTPAGAAYCMDSAYAFPGELGNGSIGDASVPVAVAGGLTFRTISVGDMHSCALTAASVAYCWGDDRFGQLGASKALGDCVADGLDDPSGHCSLTPVPVGGGLTFVQISAGESHTCGLATGGSVYCWGDNQWGQLGDGTTASGLVPVAVTGGLTFESIGAGSGTTCGLATNGSAYCWGLNNGGQLGDSTMTGPQQCVDPYNGGSRPCSSSPVVVAGGLRFSQISVGHGSSCGITIAAVYCWGWHTRDLGNGSTMNSAFPVAVALPAGISLTQLSAEGASCGLAGDGSAYCWGVYRDPNFGVHLLPPTKVPGGLSFTSLSSGTRTCGVTREPAVYCWEQWNTITNPVKAVGQP